MTATKSKSSKLTQILLATTLGTSLIVTQPPNASAASEGISISLNGQTQTFALQPMIIEDRVYVPVRALLEAYGYQVEWDESNRMVIAQKGKKSLAFSLNFPQVVYRDAVGNQSLPGVKIKIVEGSSMIPTRTLSEALGMEVRWDAGTQTVFIDSSKTALFDAIMLNDVSTARKLLASGTDPNSLYRYKSAMRYAVSSQTPAIVQLLLESGATVTDDDLWATTLRGDAELIHFLLKNGKHEKSAAELATQLMSNAFSSTEMILTLLELGADPNVAKSGYGDTALTVMKETGDSVAFEALLKAGADPNSTVTHDNQSSPLLLQLVNQGNIELTQLLLKFKADPNCQTQDGWTPLMIAADNGNAKLVQTLLAHGAKIDAKNAGGATALAIAQAHGNTVTAQALIAAGAEASSDTLLEEALFREYPESITSRYMTALDAAVALGHTERVKQLLAEGPIQDETIRRVFDTAVGKGNIETLQALLEKGNLVPTIRLVCHAMVSGNQEVLRLLALHEKTDLISDPVGDVLPISLLTLGVKSEYSYNILQEAGFDANAKVADITILMKAAESGSLGIVRRLLAAGADVNLINSEGETALDLAIRLGHPKTASILLTTDNLTQATKDNALLAAVKRDSLEMVTLLVLAGADVHFQSPTGQSPLQQAKQNGSPELIEFLTSAGATE